MVYYSILLLVYCHIFLSHCHLYIYCYLFRFFDPQLAHYRMGFSSSSLGSIGLAAAGRQHVAAPLVVTVGLENPLAARQPCAGNCTFQQQHALKVVLAAAMPLLFIVQLLAVAAASCIDSECDGHGMLQVHMDNHSDGNRQGNMFQQYKNTRERDIGMLTAVLASCVSWSGSWMFCWKACFPQRCGVTDRKGRRCVNNKHLGRRAFANTDERERQTRQRLGFHASTPFQGQMKVEKLIQKHQ